MANHESFLSFLKTAPGSHVASFILGHAVAKDPEVIGLIEALGHRLSGFPSCVKINSGEFLLGFLSADKSLSDALRAGYSLPENGAAVSLESQHPTCAPGQEVECPDSPAEPVDSGESDDEYDVPEAGDDADCCGCDPAQPATCPDFFDLTVGLGDGMSVTVSAERPVSMTVDGHVIQVVLGDASRPDSDGSEADGDDPYDEDPYT